MNHTPTPWILYERKNGPDILANGGDELIVEGGHAGQDWEANAAFIVRAVNAHDNLLFALKGLRNAIVFEQGNGYLKDYTEGFTRAFDAAQKAIAKAERPND
jgi:hypothetical protein